MLICYIYLENKFVCNVTRCELVNVVGAPRRSSFVKFDLSGQRGVSALLRGSSPISVLEPRAMETN